MPSARISFALATALALVAGMVAGAAVPSTLAAFTASTENTNNTFSAADTFCSGTSSETVNATSDSYVDQFAPENNYGGNANIRVKSHGSRSQRAYVQFALPTPPNGCSVKSATLRINISSVTASRTLEVYRPIGPWGETTVTWNNQPGWDGTAATVVTTSTSGYYEWAVTAHVLALYSGTNYGLMVKDSAEGASNSQSQIATSRDSQNPVAPPQLVVTFG